MANSTEFLRISQLHAYYGESHILHGVDLTVNHGEVVTLLGRNGAGRTTTVKSILGLVGRRTGSVMIDKQETIDWPTHEIAKLGLGYCPEERGIFSALTCEENLMLPPVIAPGGMTVDEIYEMFPNLYERRSSPGTRLSGGEQQMLARAPSALPLKPCLPMAPCKRTPRMFTKSIHWPAPCTIWWNVWKCWAPMARKRPMCSPPMCTTRHRKAGAWWRTMQVRVHPMRLQKFLRPLRCFID